MIARTNIICVRPVVNADW